MRDGLDRRRSVDFPLPRTMNPFFKAMIVGIITAAAITAWISVGYLIQRFIIRNPNPGASAILTSMVVTMVAFAIVGFWAGGW